MKYLFLLPFAILLGLVAGSWAPKKELRELHHEIQRLKQEQKNTNRKDKFSMLGNIIKVPEKKSNRKFKYHSHTNDSSELTEAEVPFNETNVNDEVSITNTPARTHKQRARRFLNPKSESYEADLEEAKELWETRVQLAREQWLSKMNLKGESIDLFDQAIADMNNKLYLTMQVTAEELQNTDKMSAETGLRIMNSVTETLVETYDQIGSIVPDDKRSDVETTEISDFIDPAAFEPLIGVRDKL